MLSAPQFEHTASPFAENFPAGHGVMVEDPSGTHEPEPSTTQHELPAGHAAHDSRVFGVPPDVYSFASHVSQLGCPVASLYLRSLPQFWHVELPPVENVPFAHELLALFPEHANPAGQRSHRSRVVAAPPAVKDPAGQTLQDFAAGPEYWASFPQALHAEIALPPAAALAVPPGQRVGLLVPSQ